jgi:protein-S-isoprenylcysteine O-methyltransferase Ste14
MFEVILRQYADVALVALAFAGYVVLWKLKARDLRRRHGAEANALRLAIRPTQRYFSVMEKVMTVGIVLILTAHCLLPRNFFLVQRVFGDGMLFHEGAGFLICLAGLAICRAAQIALGRSWRVGIEENARTGLVTGGIYRLVRNPTYSGMFLLCAGVWIVLPTVLISYWILVFFIMMEFQVRCEEEYLEKQYGAEFLDYKRRTKRYIPFLY